MIIAAAETSIVLPMNTAEFFTTDPGANQPQDYYFFVYQIWAHHDERGIVQPITLDFRPEGVDTTVETPGADLVLDFTSDADPLFSTTRGITSGITSVQGIHDSVKTYQRLRNSSVNYNAAHLNTEGEVITATGTESDFGALNIISTSASSGNAVTLAGNNITLRSTAASVAAESTDITGIRTTGQMSFDLFSSVANLSLTCGTFTGSFPTTIPGTTTLAGTYSASGAISITVEEGADVSGLTLQGGPWIIVGAVEADFASVPDGTVFPFVWTVNVDRVADITVLNSSNVVTTFLNTNSTTLNSATFPPGTYTIVANTAGFVGTPQIVTVTGETTVSLTTLDLSLLGYPSDTPNAGRGTYVYSEETYNGRATLHLQQVGGNTVYEPSQGLRMFGDLPGFNNGTDNLFGNVLARNFAEMQTAATAGSISVAEMFSLNADGVVRLRFPVFRLRARTPLPNYTIYVDDSEALVVDGSFLFIDGYTGTGTFGGAPTATPPSGIQASSLSAAGDSIVARVNANTDSEVNELEETVIQLAEESIAVGE